MFDEQRLWSELGALKAGQENTDQHILSVSQGLKTHTQDPFAHPQVAAQEKKESGNRIALFISVGAVTVAIVQSIPWATIIKRLYP